MPLPPILLASASPRRRELLARLVPDFQVEAPEIDEDALVVSDLRQTARRVSRAKAFAALHRHPEMLVLGGDTVVDLDGQLLGKPKDAEDAVRILMVLSGRTHRVHTGVAGFNGRRRLGEVVTSFVRFHRFTAQKARAYVQTGEPMDKAGAYGVQGAGNELIAEVRGSLTGVMGLPLPAVHRILTQFGYRLPEPVDAIAAE
jgi:septum formation protein